MTPLLLFLLASLLAYLGTLEMAFSALMRLSLRLVAERKGHSELLGRYLDDPLLFFVPVRLLASCAAVLIVVLVVRLIGLDSWRHAGAIVVSAAAVVVVCQHVLPVLIVRRDPERVLDAMLPSFAVLARLAHPFTVGAIRFTGGRRERAPVSSPDMEEQQGEAAQALFEAGEQEGLIEGDERRLIQSIVEFGDTLVREVMTPRPDIVAIRATETLADLRGLLREQAYSRIPVFNESLDNILGFVFVKDLIQLTGAEDRPLTTLMRPAHFVPETKRVSDLLKEFQREQVQIAIVVDEYGGTAGLVSIEDLLEEIVGEIRDEYDEESEPIVEVGDGVFLFSGKVDIDEVIERLSVDIEREGFETVGGWLLTHLGRVPTVGERLDVDGVAVEVVEAERRRITKVRVQKLAGAADTSPDRA